MKPPVLSPRDKEDLRDLLNTLSRRCEQYAYHIEHEEYNTAEIYWGLSASCDEILEFLDESTKHPED